RVEAFHLSAKGRRGWWHGAAFNLVQGLATQVVVRHGLSNQIVKINERIDELNQNKETYAIESFPSETWNSSSIETDPEWYAISYCLLRICLLVLEFEVVSLVLFFARKLSIYSSSIMAVQRTLEIIKITSRSVDHLATTTITEAS
uniref:Uncharacterized protein n=1 Tax=Aegilops tauschii subsp. strangulata TaxID=200361 RepID=A0A453S833_AEGTS